MAVSPTSKHGIPKIDGVKQLLTGPGDINAALDAIDGKIAVDDQGPLTSRPTSTMSTPGKAGRYYFATDTGQLFRDNGTGWTLLQPAPAQVTSLPTSPVDGQEVCFLADAANGVVWRLRYRAAAAGARKWEFVGGPPLAGRSDGGSTANSPGEPGQAMSPAVTPPLAGDYLADYGATVTNDTANRQVIVRCRQAGVVTTIGSFIQGLPANAYTALSGSERMDGLSAGVAVQLNVISNGAGIVGTHARWLKLTPIRVG